MSRKNKNSLLHHQTVKKRISERALPLCLSLPFYLTYLMMLCVRFACCVRALFRENQEKRKMRAVSSCQRLYVSPAPIVVYGVLCVLAFLDRRPICGSKCACVLRELRRVILYTVPYAVLSFRRVFIVFLFSAVVQ